MPESEDKRPVGCRFWLADDVANWIAIHVEFRQIGYESSLDAARWWRSHQVAIDINECYKLQDFMELVHDGLPAMTDDDVSDELQAPHLNDSPEQVQVLDEYIEEELSNFFDVNRIKITSGINCDVCGQFTPDNDIHVIPDERTVCKGCHDRYNEDPAKFDSENDSVHS